MVVSPRKSNNSGDTTTTTNVHLKFYHLLYKLLYMKMLFKSIPNKINSKFIDKVFKNKLGLSWAKLSPNWDWNWGY